MSAILDVEDTTALVIDNGSGCIKAGYSGDETPRFNYQNLIGKPKLDVCAVGSSIRNSYFGHMEDWDMSIMSLNYPIERGIVKNWDDMETVWQHTFYNELRVSPEEHLVLLTEPPYNPSANREKSAELMFEKFSALGLNVSLTSTLGLYASGRHCAIVVEIGDGVTSVAPMKGVYCWKHAVKRFHLGGRDLTNYLSTLLRNRGLYFYTSNEQQIVRQMKEKLGKVRNTEQKDSLDSCFTLPDGQEITVGEEVFQCTEPLFDPSILGYEHAGLSQLIYDTIMSIDIHVRRDIYVNIILAGGSTLFPGFVERVQKEVEKLAPPSIRVKVVAHDERQYYSWIGGSILSSLSCFKDVVVTKQQYEEVGPSIIHKYLM